MDLISRQAAIDALENQKDKNAKGDIGGFYNTIIQHDIDAIAELPSVQPERKKGEWIDNSEDGYVECPFCHSATNCDDNINELHFCFSCGAKMEVQDASTVLSR